MWASFFTGLISPITSLISEGIEDKDKANAIGLEVKKLLAGASERADAHALELMKSRTSVILAEANGASWLQRNWRPLMMLWFAILLGMYWFDLTPANLTQETLNQLFGLMKIGIGGYVVGRSAEKVVPFIVDAMSKK